MQHAVHNKVLRSSCFISEADFASDSQTRTKQSLILAADFIEMLNESRSSPSNCLVSLYCIVELSITTRNFFFFLESMRLVNIFGRGRQFWHYGIKFKFSFVLNNSTKNKSKYFLICTPKMYKIWNFFIDFCTQNAS